MAKEQAVDYKNFQELQKLVRSLKETKNAHEVLAICDKLIENCQSACEQDAMVFNIAANLLSSYETSKESESYQDYLSIGEKAAFYLTSPISNICKFSYLIAVDFYLATAQADKAIEVCQRLISAKQSDHAVYCNLGLAYIMKSNYPQAIENLCLAITLLFPEEVGNIVSYYYHLSQAYQGNQELYKALGAIKYAKSLLLEDNPEINTQLEFVEVMIKLSGCNISETSHSQIDQMEQ
jgi:tetratricopeptide (TPR) repeat protein